MTYDLTMTLFLYYVKVLKSREAFDSFWLALCKLRQFHLKAVPNLGFFSKAKRILYILGKAVLTWHMLYFSSILK